MSETKDGQRTGLGTLLGIVLCTGLGLAAGRYVAVTDVDPARDDHGHDDHDHDDHGHGDDEDHDHDDEVIEFSQSALANMGVRIGALEASTWVRTRPVAARIEADPLAERAVHVPLGGRVLEVPALALGVGATVAPGSVLAVLAREPLPLPVLEHTKEAVHPDHGELHQAMRLLLQAEAEGEIARAELERLGEFTGVDAPLVPRERIVALEYDLRRAGVNALQARRELELHGLSDEQIERLLSHGDEGDVQRHAPVIDAATVRRALVHRGQWSEGAERLLRVLPEPLRSLPLAVGTVAELEVSGLAGEELALWLEEDATAAGRCLHVAALLLAGRSLADVRALHDDGALDARIEIVAPADGGPWQLEDVLLRPGATAGAGAMAVRLVDLSRVRLVASPVGGEAAVIRDAVASGIPCRATPLMPGTGPELEDVTLLQLTQGTGGELAAWAALENAPLGGGDGAATGLRSWSLLPGTLYTLRVPVERLEDVWVLPRAALAEHGAERLVLLPDAHGDVFEDVPVTIAAEDDEGFALVPGQQDERLRPGVKIVTRGAFALGLALHGGDEGGGHHHHDH